MKTNFQSLHIPFESDLWSLFLNDPWYMEHSKEMDQYLSNNFPVDYHHIKSHYKEVPQKRKEVRMLKNLCEKFKLKQQVYVFESRNPDINIECRYSQDSAIFIISYPLNKILLETELYPLFVHELGHWIFPSPINFDVKYFIDKLEQAKSPEEQNPILRLYYLINVISAITEYNADRLALWLTSFEITAAAFTQFFRIAYRRNFYFNMETLVRNYPTPSEAHQAYLFKDMQSLRPRLLAMFLFCRKHNLIESESLKDIQPKISLSDLIDPKEIMKTYYRLLDPAEAPHLSEILRNEVYHFLSHCFPDFSPVLTISEQIK
jgi:hypothetical protein